MSGHQWRRENQRWLAVTTQTFLSLSLSWLRHAPLSGKSPIYQSGLIFGLISNWFRNFYTGLTLVSHQALQLLSSHVMLVTGNKFLISVCNPVYSQHALMCLRTIRTRGTIQTPTSVGKVTRSPQPFILSFSSSFSLMTLYGMVRVLCLRGYCLWLQRKSFSLRSPCCAAQCSEAVFLWCLHSLHAFSHHTASSE